MDVFNKLIMSEESAKDLLIHTEISLTIYLKTFKGSSFHDSQNYLFVIVNRWTFQKCLNIYLIATVCVLEHCIIHSNKRTELTV